MKLSQYISVTLKETGWGLEIKAGDISGIIDNPEGLLIILSNGLAYQVKESLGEVAKKMQDAQE